MLPRLITLLLLVTGLVLAACSNTVTSDDPDADVDRDPPVVTITEHQRQVIDADNAFGLRLFQTLSEEAPDDNLFVSPLSVSMALGMTLNGAEGGTRTAMAQTLALSDLSLDQINTSYRALLDLYSSLDANVRLDIANAIWHRDTFPVEQPFLDRNTEHFDALVQALDFNDAETPNVINGWVRDKTEGKIEKIIDGPIDPLTMLYLINAVYFKGDWTYPFDPEGTQDDVFTRADGTTTPVRMMTMGGVHFAYAERDGVQAIDLPYGDSLFSMMILLPPADQPLEPFIAALDADAWQAWTTDLASAKLDLFQMPTFTLEYEVSLKKALAALGMAVAFDPHEADFSGINPTRTDLHISEVKHKTFIEVDEKGTEAGAVTSVVVGVTSAGPTPPLTMRVDRPFVFALREQATGAILFLGKMMDP